MQVGLVIVVLLWWQVAMRMADFVIPSVTLEAYEPRGLRASIPAQDGIHFFAFHAKINKQIDRYEIGDYNVETREPKDNLWSFFEPDVSLKVGDRVNYWVYLQYKKLGYRRENQSWTVEELLPLRDSACQKSITVVAGRPIVCKSDLFFEEDFNGTTIDPQKWTLEQYIPQAPDYEFVSYQRNPEVVSVNEGWLVIQPKALQNDSEVRGNLSLRDQCTRQDPDECFYSQTGVFILPPVISARLVSKVHFRYGLVEIKAHLPAGDWIYPQLYLEEVSNPHRKLHVAYSRGNAQLSGASGDDLGSKLLFGGPSVQSAEPLRSSHLKSLRRSVPFNSQMHNYGVKWGEEVVTLHVDDVQYGLLTKKDVKEVAFGEESLVRLVIGIGVGGINDFPDNFKSGNVDKPWQNRGRTQVKDFFVKRKQWTKTWTGPLQVDSVKITALP